MNSKKFLQVCTVFTNGPKWFVISSRHGTTIFKGEHNIVCLLSEEIGHISQFSGYEFKGFCQRWYDYGSSRLHWRFLFLCRDQIIIGLFAVLFNVLAFCLQNILDPLIKAIPSIIHVIYSSCVVVNWTKTKIILYCSFWKV